MNFTWIWPNVTDKGKARNAVRTGFYACMFIAAMDFLVAISSLMSHQKVEGYDGWTMVDGVIFAVIGWRLLKNSRTWAAIGVGLMFLEIYDKLEHATNTFGIITVILLLALVNAARGVFAYRDHELQEKAILNAMADHAGPPANVSAHMNEGHVL